ncbi:MAG: potassium transporter TrkG [Bacteroidales bacterium]
MDFTHWNFLYKLYWKKIQKALTKASSIVLFISSVLTLLFIVYQFGFTLTQSRENLIFTSRIYLLAGFFIGISLHYISHFQEVIREKMFAIDLLLYLCIPIIFILRWYFCGYADRIFTDASDLGNPPYLWQRFFLNRYFIYSLLTFFSIIHLSRFIFSFIHRNVKPALLFIGSFLLLILAGSGLLMLPNATYNGISLIDALFMATTSVCVTGLTVVDVGSAFTPMGQIILLLLIQIGGIGVITFTSFFALSFMSNTSFESQLILKDMLNEKKLGNLFRILIHIIFVSFLFETIGAYLIWNSVSGTLGSAKEELFFSIFHSISAYCNAGISNLDNNLGNSAVIGNYQLHLWIGVLIILGGIGFPILFNYIHLFRHTTVNLFKTLIGKQKHYFHIPHIINLHTYLAVSTTLILVGVGTLLFFLIEYNHTLSNLPIEGRIIESFFYAVTPRTAGFSTYSLSLFSSPALLLTVLLMFIGASPMSTGGGIKTTTVAVAFLTTWGIIKNKDHIEVKHRHLSRATIRQAFAIIILFIGWTVFATFLLSLTETHCSIFQLFFETVSATATAGLSMGITPSLSTYGKTILILSMFIGRIGVLTFFTGITIAHQNRRYNYPKETLLLG